jgi:coenzyme F420-reducing hydrogenase delta subunit
VAHVQDLLKNIGLEPERVHMYHLSSAMAGQFAAATKEMADKVEALGPNPLRARVRGDE